MSESRSAGPGANEYLSIREVLDELVTEFDDVTISKIRFLESRGLIHPERTPSGYRKFFPSDVERLRWILRQQRENFLPLKVIKRRLDVEDGKTPELPDSPSLFDDDIDLIDRDRELANIVSNIRQSARPIGINGELSNEDQGHQAIVNDSVSSLHHVAAETSAIKPRLAAVRTAEEPTPHDEDKSRESQDDLAARHPNHPSQGEHGDEQAVLSDSFGPASQDVNMVNSDPAGIGGVVPEISEATHFAAQDLTDVSLSIDELASAASTTVDVVAELEEFGFIASRVVAGIPCFDGRAVVIAKAIVSLRSYGLEPRHLKSIRYAAERDAALFSQAVAPLLRQRNPEARMRAKKQLEELADKGAALYEQILRAELRRIGG